MRNFKKINLNIILFILVLTVCLVLSLTNQNTQTVSKYENRKLKERPTFTFNDLKSGKYFKDFDEYFSDNFVFRDTLVKVSMNIKELRKSPFKEKQVALKDKQEKDKHTIKNNDEKAGVESVDEPIELTGNYAIWNNSSIEVYKNNQALYATYGKAINRFKEKVGKDVKVYSLIAPTAFEFTKNERIKKLGSPEINDIDYLKNCLNKDVNYVDVYKTLQGKQKEYIYFRSDHHWTTLGAFYAYETFMSTKKEEPIKLDKYESGVIKNYLGTYYGATLSEELKQKPDSITYYKPFTKNSFYKFKASGKEVGKIIDFQASEAYDKYCLFLGGTKSRGVIKTDVKNGKKILVVKDSYANSFIPFLLPHYEEIHFIDPREGNVNLVQFTKQNNIQEVLFLNYVFSVTKYEFPKLLIDNIK